MDVDHILQDSGAAAHVCPKDYMHLLVHLHHNSSQLQIQSLWKSVKQMSRTKVTKGQCDNQLSSIISQVCDVKYPMSLMALMEATTSTRHRSYLGAILPGPTRQSWHLEMVPTPTFFYFQPSRLLTRKVQHCATDQQSHSTSISNIYRSKAHGRKPWHLDCQWQLRHHGSQETTTSKVYTREHAMSSTYRSTWSETDYSHKTWTRGHELHWHLPKCWTKILQTTHSRRTLEWRNYIRTEDFSHRETDEQDIHYYIKNKNEEQQVQTRSKKATTRGELQPQPQHKTPKTNTTAEQD